MREWIQNLPEWQGWLLAVLIGTLGLCVLALYFDMLGAIGTGKDAQESETPVIQENEPEPVAPEPAGGDE